MGVQIYGGGGARYIEGYRVDMELIWGYRYIWGGGGGGGGGAIELI